MLETQSMGGRVGGAGGGDGQLRGLRLALVKASVLVSALRCGQGKPPEKGHSAVFISEKLPGEKNCPSTWARQRTGTNETRTDSLTAISLGVFAPLPFLLLVKSKCIFRVYAI